MQNDTAPGNRDYDALLDAPVPITMGELLEEQITEAERSIEEGEQALTRRKELLADPARSVERLKEELAQAFHDDIGIAVLQPFFWAPEPITSPRLDVLNSRIDQAFDVWKIASLPLLALAFELRDDFDAASDGHFRFLARSIESSGERAYDLGVFGIDPEAYLIWRRGMTDVS